MSRAGAMDWLGMSASVPCSARAPRPYMVCYTRFRDWRRSGVGDAWEGVEISLFRSYISSDMDKMAAPMSNGIELQRPENSLHDRAETHAIPLFACILPVVYRQASPPRRIRTPPASALRRVKESPYGRV